MIAWGGVWIAPDRSTAPGDLRPFLPAISAPAPDAASPQILVVENHPSLQVVTRNMLAGASSAQTLQQCLLTWLPAGRVVGKARSPGRSSAAPPV